MRAMQLGQQQARRVHIAAGDVRMDVDRARHDDMAGAVDLLIGLAAAGRRRDDAAVLEPDVANAVLARRRIDDMAATQNCQQGATSETCAMMASMTSATVGASDGVAAVRSVMPPVSWAMSTASWVTPGWPTSM